MNHNKSYCIISSSTSSFVSYTDFTTTSARNYSNILQIITKPVPTDDQPNIETLYAIEEARDHENLKTYHDISDFFSDLEK